MLFKTFYAAAKTNILKLVQPLIEKMMEEEEISGLDDIPDASEEKEPVKKQIKKEPVKTKQAKHNKPQNHQVKKNPNKSKQTGK